MQKIRLLIMGEPQGLRQGLVAIFAAEEDFEVVHVSRGQDDSVADAQKIQPDAILCTFSPNQESMRRLKQLKEACPYTKIFIFMSQDNREEAQKAVTTGADGYLTKSMLPTHLVKAVELGCRTGVICYPGSLKQWLNKEKVFQVEEIGKVDAREKLTSFHRKSVNVEGSPPLLTPREKEIYKLLTQNYSNKEIGNRLFISQPTVKSHVSNILRKLGLNNRIEIILYEIESKDENATSFPRNKDLQINS